MNRIMIGYDDNNNFRLRVSQPGVDVLTATSLADFMLHEDYYSGQLIMDGSATMPYSGSPDNQYLEIPLVGFNYVPYVHVISGIVLTGGVVEANGLRTTLSNGTFEVTKDLLKITYNTAQYQFFIRYRVFGTPLVV